ncbi:MAG: nitrile hydratase accessory protein, partial [Deltaproteobacteria bacterium]|nr:nitrile hydratase accessory protein [Deltaproteobacteria bacterium]
RFMVLPERPPGTEQLSEDELAAVVTRDAMIGVTRVQLDKRVTSTLSQRQVADMAGTVALPRQSGELVFQDPWEGCVFALAVALCEQGLYRWSEFRDHFVTEIAAAERPEIPSDAKPTYYECWLAALEALLIEKAMLTKKKIDTRGGWLARAAMPSHSRSFLHLRWDMSEDDEEA